MNLSVVRDTVMVIGRGHLIADELLSGMLMVSFRGRLEFMRIL